LSSDWRPAGGPSTDSEVDAAWDQWEENEGAVDVQIGGDGCPVYFNLPPTPDVRVQQVKQSVQGDPSTSCPASVILVLIW
jgi:hypothetical protein